jgi:hypothetical protein
MSFFDSAFVRGVIVPVAVVLALTLLRKYLPVARAGRSRFTTTPEMPIEPSQGAKWLVGTSMLLVGLAIAYGGYKSLLYLNQYFAHREGPANFQLLPSTAIWCFLPGFAALALPWEIVLQIWQRFGDRQKAWQYASWSSAKSGFDCTRALRWMAVIILVPIALFTIPAIPMHTTLHDNEMHIREYAGTRTLHYRYNQAQRLFVEDGLRDRSGKFTPRAEIVVDFADGRRWGSADNRDFVAHVEPGLGEFFVEKTGLPLNHVKANVDLPVSNASSK